MVPFGCSGEKQKQIRADILGLLKPLAMGLC
jgi:hypothetical protein